MYDVLKSSKIIIDSRGDIRFRGNHDIDLAMNETMNMRIFEATGCGAFLLTEYFDNLNSLFEVGKEIETFKNEKELIEKIEYYLDHEDERAAIAKRGQQRCLRDYSMNARTKAFDELIQKYLQTQSNMPETSNKNLSSGDAVEYFKEAYKLVNSKKYQEAFYLLNKLKSFKLNFENVDLLRAICFINFNDLNSAKQSLLEELNFFPNNTTAKDLLQSLNFQSNLLFEDPEFADIFKIIEPYTMLSQQRLYSLFQLSKWVCENDIPGNFVECGVARGGSSALLSYVIKKYSKQPRYHYAFDSFEGMPEPAEEDVHGKFTANEIGWGTGTCAAPMQSLMEVASLLNTTDIIKPVKGYFSDTLPKLKNEINKIAFLHLDGDWYESTKTVLDNLFTQVAENGVLQVDDYGFWNGCKKALHEFENEKRTKFNLNKIDDTGVWFKKETSSSTDYLKNNNSLQLLNLGCGNHFHKDWINVDFNSNTDKVIKYDLTQTLPFQNNSFDVVYHSHLLEHFPKNYAPKFLNDCFRILKTGGIIRVVVPDLEQIIKQYNRLLEESLKGDKAAQEKYEWIMLELYDQAVRNFSGGEMLRYWQQERIPAENFVIERMGAEAQNVINSVRKNGERFTKNETVISDPGTIGQFRVSGEIHQWMYDRYSLRKLLEQAGFKEIKVCAADESSIPDFNDYYLDIEKDYSIRKPDSLFMEGRK